MRKELIELAKELWKEPEVEAESDDQSNTFRYWRQFHDERKLAVDTFCRGGGAVLLRKFIARCEKMDMPWTAEVLRGLMTGKVKEDV